MDKRILVTGAAGFIGRHALQPLRARGFEVHALTRATADLNDAAAVRRALDAVRPTHLLHLAWYTGHGKFWDSPRNLESLAATLSLLRAFAERGGRRFVGAGTSAEYDWNGPATRGLPPGSRLEEFATPLRPARLYGAAKASAFMTGSAFARIAGIEFAWGRVFQVFGPGENDRRLVPALIRAHLQGGKLDCGQETQARDFLPATAVGDAFARLCESDIEGPVNIGSGRETSLRELSDGIAALAGSRGEIRFGAYPDAGPERLVPDVRRLRDEVGWTPGETLQESLRQAVDGWKTPSRST